MHHAPGYTTCVCDSTHDTNYITPHTPMVFATHHYDVRVSYVYIKCVFDIFH